MKSKKQIDADDKISRDKKGLVIAKVRVPKSRRKEIIGIASLMRAEHYAELDRLRDMEETAPHNAAK